MIWLIIQQNQRNLLLNYCNVYQNECISICQCTVQLSVVVIIQYSERVLISFAFHFAGAVSKQEPCFDNGTLWNRKQ